MASCEASVVSCAALVVSEELAGEVEVVAALVVPSPLWSELFDAEEDCVVEVVTVDDAAPPWSCSVVSVGVEVEVEDDA